MAEYRNLNNYSVRIASAVVLGLVFLVLLHLGTFIPLLVVMVIGMLGLHEFLRLTTRPLTPLFQLGVLLIVNLIYIAHYSRIIFPWGLAFSLWLAYVIWDMLLFRAGEMAEGRLNRIVYGYTGVVFLGLLGYLISFVIVGNRIMAADPSLANPVLLIPMCGSWAYDTGAFFSGKILGCVSFAPRFSPRKTWEGVVGGFVSCVLALLLVRALFFQPDQVTSPAHWIAVAVFLAMFALIGDLFVSILKREAGVKDSGVLIPGHGGVLDRLDSFLAVLPIAYFALPYLFTNLSYTQLVGV